MDNLKEGNEISSMNIVEKFKHDEKLKCNWLEKILNNYPVFYHASDIKIKSTIKENNFIVKPSKLKRFLAILFICFGMFGWFSISLLVIQKIILPISIAFLTLMTLWIGSIIWVYFLNPKNTYQIFIDDEKIILGKQTFIWSNVTDYLLMVKGSGRYEVDTLVIFINDSQIMKYNLTYLNKSGFDIISGIEYFKSINK